MVHIFRNPEEIGALVDVIFQRALAHSPTYWQDDAEYKLLLRQKAAVRVLRRLRAAGELQGTLD